MFHKILIALDHSKADEELISRVAQLARLTQAQILLLHVSTGWAAHWQDNLNLSDSQEMKEDREYLEKVARELRSENFQVATHHASGEPARAILKTAATEHCDLIAMATHGHTGVSDVIHGQTVNHVRHRVKMPVLLLKRRQADR